MKQKTYEEIRKDTYEKVEIHELINFDKEPDYPIKVSIVIPVCNVEQYLRECIESAINQTLQEIEIICVNDGSNDGSLEILKEYAKKDERVKIIDKDNAGYGHTMNIGMDMAKGEYIGIIESDDYVEIHMYDELYQVAQREEVDFVKSDFYRFCGKYDSVSCEYYKIAREDKNYNVIINPSERPESFKFIMNTWSGLYNTEFIKKNCIRHNETPGASFQDNGFWFKTNALAEKTWYLNKAFYMNRRDNPNSSVYNPQKIYCINDEYEFIYKYMEEKEIKQKFLAAYMFKKFHSYMFTLNRINIQYKKEYLKKFSDEFLETEKKGELVSKYFSANDWNNIQWIMRDYEEYYYEKIYKEIKVSVILPVYNTGNYLDQCLNSLLEQTLKDIEIICINDGSTDNSLEILMNYQIKDRRIKIVNQENKGAGFARNIGINIAKGEYLSFLDSDDYFEKDMLKQAYNRAEEKKADICIYESSFYDNKTGKISKCNFSVRKNELPKADVFSRGQITSNIFTSIMGWAWDKLYRRSFVLNHKLEFQEQRSTNDMYFVYSSLLRAGRITLLNKPLYYQRRNVSTSLSNTRELSWNCFFYALLEIKKELEKLQIYEEYNHDFINYALHSCLWNFNTLNEPEAEKLFIKLREKWFEELGINGHDEKFFTNKIEYRQYKEINKISLEDEAAYCKYKINYWKNKYEFDIENSLLSIPVKISNKETLTVGQMKEKLIWNRSKKMEAENKIKRLEKERNFEVIKKNLEQYKYDSYCLNEIKKSLSYKIAMFITWLPRKIKGIFQ